MPVLETMTLKVASYRHITPAIIQDMSLSDRYSKLRTIDLEYNPDIGTDLDGVIPGAGDAFDTFNEAAKEELGEKGNLLAYDDY